MSISGSRAMRLLGTCHSAPSAAVAETKVQRITRAVPGAFERRTIHIDDAALETKRISGSASAAKHRARRYRTMLVVRCCAKGAAVGASRLAPRSGRSPTSRSGPAADLRRPGGDRDRERAPVQRDEGRRRSSSRPRRARSCGSYRARRRTCSRSSRRSRRARARSCEPRTPVVYRSTASSMAGYASSAFRSDAGGRSRSTGPVHLAGRSSTPGQLRGGHRAAG